MNALQSAPPFVEDIPKTDVRVPVRLEVNDIDLHIGERVVLDKIGFEVGVGEVVGLLGPNGSGKSSLIRCIVGLWRSQRGAARIDGTPVDVRHRTNRAKLGVVFQDPSLDKNLTAEENLWLAAALFGIDRREAQTRTRDLLEFMELSDRHDDYVKNFSGGMCRRLEIVRALIHRPTLLILDEPTNGLDPYAVKRTWQLLHGLRQELDLSLLVSTHHAEEAERFDRLVVLDRGHVIANETPGNLLARLSEDVISLEVANPSGVATQIGEHFEIEPQVIDQTIIIETEAGHALIPRLVEAFPQGTFRSINMRRPSLADAFFKLTGRSLIEEQGVTS